jgi:RHS repeat-associated protein
MPAPSASTCPGTATARSSRCWSRSISAVSRGSTSSCARWLPGACRCGTRSPTSTITTTLYDPATGQLTERRLPAGPNGGSAHSTVFSYYTGGDHPTDGACGNTPQWAGLPCKTRPAAQPGTPGLPDLPVSHTTAYDMWDQPTSIVDTSGASTRTTTLGYDAAGRPTSHDVDSDAGTDIPQSATTYHSATGRPYQTTAGGLVITRNYDTLGRLASYQDADGNTSTYTYDTLDRPLTLDDGKGTRTYTYNGGSERRGLPTQIVDSAAGTFTATWTIDGQLATQTYPGGLTATYTYNESNSLAELTYTKPSSSYPTFSLEHGIDGIVQQASTLSAQRYTYDAAGRLTTVEDTPNGAGCTVRLYGFDADTNRTSLTTRDPNSDGTCPTAGGSTTTRTYDAADRATLTGYTYDPFGRTTTIPAADTPTGTQTTLGYYVNDLVHSTGTGSATSTFGLDPARRFRNTTDSLTGITHTNHYTDDSDLPAWTTDDTAGSAWTRHIPAFNGLAAIHTHTASGDTIALQLTSPGGDIIATTTPSDTSTSTPGLETTEYGLPRPTSDTARYAHLGTHQRHRDNTTALTLMGVRAYNPATGRFLQIDPVMAGSANRYDYVSGNPTSRLDLTGTEQSSGGPGYWVSWFCLSQILRCLRARETNDVAVNISKHIGFTTDGPINAARHFIWQALLTMRFGVQFAEGLGINHERDNLADGDSLHDSYVDYNNNVHGQRFGRHLLRFGYSWWAKDTWRVLALSARWLIYNRSLCGVSAISNCPFSFHEALYYIGP